jgi:hypothetical protein
MARMFNSPEAGWLIGNQLRARLLTLDVPVMGSDSMARSSDLNEYDASHLRHNIRFVNSIEMFGGILCRET